MSDFQTFMLVVGVCTIFAIAVIAEAWGSIRYDEKKNRW